MICWPPCMTHRASALAAVQVGEPLRIFTVDCSKRAEDEEEAGDGKPIRESDAEDSTKPEEEERDPIFLINPENSFPFPMNAVSMKKGCLSIPDYYADVERPAACTIKYIDRDGKDQVLEADGLLATVIQHEFDHLNGVLFVDHISKLKRGHGHSQIHKNCQAIPAPNLSVKPWLCASYLWERLTFRSPRCRHCTPRGIQS